MKHSSNVGFSLVEILVVVAILSILATVGLSSINQGAANARDAKRVADLEAIEQALLLYYQANGHYPYGQPADLQGGTMIGVGTWIDAELAPYMSEVPADPIHNGTTYYYSYDPIHQYSTDCVSVNGYATVIGFHRSETKGEIRKDICMGGDQGLNDAHYNVALFPAAD